MSMISPSNPSPNAGCPQAATVYHGDQDDNLESLNGHDDDLDGQDLSSQDNDGLDGQDNDALDAQDNDPDSSLGGQPVYDCKRTLPLRERDLPPVIRDIVANAPDIRKLHAFIACLAPLCALATRVRLKYYYDARPSALILQVIIEGPQASGKSFAADIEDLIMRHTLKARDKAQRRREQEYREKKKRRAQNKQLEEEPQTTVCVIPATISKTVLTKRADSHERILGDYLTFWMFAEELAQVTDAGRQGYSNLRTIMRTAYDLGSYFGIDFASDNSYSAIVDINICYMFCATPSAVDHFMDKESIEGGNITRCILCNIDDPLGSKAAIFKPYTDEQRTAISYYLQRIMSDTYQADGSLKPTQTLDMTWIDSACKRWNEKKMKLAADTNSKAINTFRKRASVSAFRIAALCYYLYRLDDERPELLPRYQKRCLRLYHFMAEYILDKLLNRWGKRYDELTADDQPVKYSVKRRDNSLIDQLPEQFTRAQLQLACQRLNLGTPPRQFIYMWLQSGEVRALDKNHFVKMNP